MVKWFFPSRCFGEIEGFSNPGLEMFKGEPIRAMAREVCQNSLDAKKHNGAPLRVEFKRYFVKVSDFPGMLELKNTLYKCRNFWASHGDEKTRTFVRDAIKAIEGDHLFVLRISDYNTTGLKGAFDAGNAITPWKGLVQGNAFSFKASESAAGSFGIGKAAPFVVSKLQTVFYRTLDEDGVRAAQGVTHLVSFEDESAPAGEDKIRRSTGYYGESYQNQPLKSMPLLDKLDARTESGTDLFVPGFSGVTKTGTWEDDIIIELLDNFLYSIFSGNMEVVVEGKIINAQTVGAYIQRLMPKTKHAMAFYEVLTNNDTVIEEIKPFHGLGNLRLRVLYKPDANKKVLVVRNSGMKITDIPSLPKGISFVAFLELQGEELNKFFRGMENPQHNKWEHKRHSNPELAQKYKEEVEDWVREYIGAKIKDICGEEIDIDLSGYFFGSEKEAVSQEAEMIEGIVDTVKTMTVNQDEPVEKKSFKVADIGGSHAARGNRMTTGIIDDKGNRTGHRHRDGKRKNASPTGRKGIEQTGGEDRVYEGLHEVDVTARIIQKNNGVKRLVFVAFEDISEGELEIVSVGENGKPLKLNVKAVAGITVDAEMLDGHIVFRNVKANQKNTIEFEIFSSHSYAMEVRAYGN